MKKRLLLFFAAAISCCAANAQARNIDSLQKIYNKTRSDTLLAGIYVDKANRFLKTNVDSGMIYSRKALSLSLRIGFKKGEVRALSSIANFQQLAGDLPGSLKTSFEVLPKAMAVHEMRVVAACYNSRGLTYSTLKDNKRALDNYYASLAVVVANHFRDLETTELSNIARAYLEMGKLDSAQYFNRRAYDFYMKNKVGRSLSYITRNFGIIKFQRGDAAAAINYYRKSLADSLALNDHYIHSEDYRRIAEAYQKLGRTDSCLAFGKLAVEAAKLAKNPDLLQRAGTLLTQEYRKKNDFKNAFYYQQLTQAAKDSLFSQQKNLQVQNLTFNEQQRREEARDVQAAYQNRVRDYTLLGIIGVFVLVACILLYANSQRKKANTVLQNTLSYLKKAQTQLVQSEKMASLGELTAGIAHEIQNPLNFVNNFSEVNREMLEELKAESEKPKAERDVQLEIELINDLINNEEKINHHGKRADAIVKGMLQHSQSGAGTKEPTNINALADECMRLAYHGLRSKDKSFNAEMVTHLDETLPLVNVIPQDMVRVMLNLFNNAFYAVNQKMKTAGNDYKPTVEVDTFFLPLVQGSPNGQGVGGLRVKDNGTGIPDAIKDKIMQPFFTTKPTGEGTGLGLSLTYDMVVKGHGGSIEVNSVEGEGSEFKITLPI